MRGATCPLASDDLRRKGAPPPNAAVRLCLSPG
jgi:hypothetical protein